MKKLKIYRVINDTRNSHGMVNTYCKYLWNAGDGRFCVINTKTGKNTFATKKT